jgi:IS30 family transposase
LSEQQDKFTRLIAQGVSNSEACRLVGINRRTGTRWRFGRTILNTAGEAVHYPPVPTASLRRRARHPRYLSLAERTVFADLRRAGATVRAIAAETGRSPSTVSRELRRNAQASGKYLPGAADQAAMQRQQKPRERRVQRDTALGAAVGERLGKRWAPEQVSHELRELFPDTPARWLCAESIYQAIYDPDVALARPAKRRRRRRRRRVQGLERRGRLAAMTMIAERPVEVADRVQVGHWEGDCIMGSGNQSAIGTVVERSTRYLILIHVPTGRPTAEAMRAGITTALTGLPPQLRRTLTWDQGKELAHHLQITATIGTAVFFCDAHSPWQRGSNENMNGLLRDYFPKGTDLSAHPPAHLLAVENELNNQPRRILGDRAPAELFAALLASEHPPVLRR